MKTLHSLSLRNQSNLKLRIIIRSFIILSFYIFLIPNLLLFTDGLYQISIYLIPIFAQLLVFIKRKDFKLNSIFLIIPFWLTLLLVSILSNYKLDEFYQISNIIDLGFLKHFILNKSLFKTFIFIGLYSLSLIPFIYHSNELKIDFKNNSNKILIYCLELIGFSISALFTPLLIDNYNIYFFWTLLLILGFAYYFLRNLRIDYPNFILSIFIFTVLIISTLVKTNSQNILALSNLNDKQYSITQTDWTTYGRLQILTYEDKPQFIKLGNHAHAFLPNSNNIKGTLDFPSFQILSTLKFKKILVLFAGAGVETQALKLLFPEAQITGVEINSKLINMANEVTPDKEKYLVKDNVRNFVEHTNQKFDLIIASYNGVQNYYLNVLQYTQNYDFFKRVFSITEPNGTVLISSLNNHSLPTVLNLLKDENFYNQFPYITFGWSIKNRTNFKFLNSHFLILGSSNNLGDFSKFSDFEIQSFESSKFINKNFIKFLKKSYFKYFNQLPPQKINDIATDDNPIRGNPLIDVLYRYIFIFSLFLIITFFFMQFKFTLNKQLLNMSLLIGFANSILSLLFQFKSLLIFSNPTNILMLSLVTGSISSLIGLNLNLRKYHPIYLVLVYIFAIFVFLLSFSFSFKQLEDFFLFFYLAFIIILIFNGFIFKNIMTQMDNFNSFWTINLIGMILGTIVCFTSFANFGGLFTGYLLLSSLVILIIYFIFTSRKIL